MALTATEEALLRDLLAKVEDRKRCTIPTPHYHAKLIHDGTTARIMGYIENYAVARHTGAVPFCIHVNDVIAHLRDLIEQAEEDDLRIQRDEAVALIDPVSLELLIGSEIDFVDELAVAEFRGRNPNAKSSCGCGVSFSI